MAAVVSSITGNFLFGIIAAMVTSALLSMILAVFSIKFLAQQIIVGVVLNVLVIGVTNFLYQQWLTEGCGERELSRNHGHNQNSGMSDIPLLGPRVLRKPHHGLLRNSYRANYLVRFVQDQIRGFEQGQLVSTHWPLTQ